VLSPGTQASASYYVIIWTPHFHLNHSSAPEPLLDEFFISTLMIC